VSVMVYFYNNCIGFRGVFQKNKSKIRPFTRQTAEIM
jgi:hypothetical protein